MDRMRCLLRFTLLLSLLFCRPAAAFAESSALALDPGESAEVTCTASRLRYSRTSFQQITLRCDGEATSTPVPGDVHLAVKSEEHHSGDAAQQVELSAGDDVTLSCAGFRLPVRFRGRREVFAVCLGNLKPERTPRPSRTPRPERTPRPTRTPEPFHSPDRTPGPTRTPEPVHSPDRTPGPTRTPEPHVSPWPTGHPSPKYTRM